MHVKPAPAVLPAQYESAATLVPKLEATVTGEPDGTIVIVAALRTLGVGATHAQMNGR